MGGDSEMGKGGPELTKHPLGLGAFQVGNLMSNLEKGKATTEYASCLFSC